MIEVASMKKYALPLAIVLSAVLPNNAHADDYRKKDHVFACTII